MRKTTNKYSPEVRERAVRLVLDNWTLSTGILMLMMTNGLMMTLTAISRGHRVAPEGTGQVQAGHLSAAMIREDEAR